MKNDIFLKKALDLLKPPAQTNVEVAQTIEIKKDNQYYAVPTTDYARRTMKKNDALIVDFGDHQVGYANFKFNYVGSHPDAPAWIRFHFAETLQELFENPDEYHGWISSSWVETEQIHIDVLPVEMKLPRRYAFRYIKIEVIDISTKYDLVVEHVGCTAVSGADDTKLKHYDFGDAQLNHLDEIACRTLHNCMQTVFEDGPKRDRRLWIGDLRIQALANDLTYDNADMVKACIYLFAALPMPDERVGACLFLEPVPEVDDVRMYDYSLFFIPILWNYYEKTKDIEMLRELWPVAYKQIAIAKKELGNDMLVQDSDEMNWCFVDWTLNLNKQASAQGILLYALSVAIHIAQELGDVMKEEELAELYMECRKAANNKLWDEKKKCYVSGREKQISIASQVWMILGEAIGGDDAIELLERVEAMDAAEEMVTPYMYHNYLDALMLLGQKEKALEVIRSYWGGMEAMGADTFWELYNPKKPDESPYGGTIVNSYCHAWSCGPAYFLRKYFMPNR